MEARQVSAHVVFEKFRDEVEDFGIQAKHNPKFMRAYVDAKKWLLAKMNRQAYDDKLNIEADVNVQHDLGQALSEAFERAKRMSKEKTSALDSEVIEIESHKAI